MFQIGDRVEVIDEDLEGVVCGLSEDAVQFESSEGFVFSYTPKALVKIGSDISVSNHQAYLAKMKKDEFPKRKSTIVKERNKTVLEVDLHIEQLTSNWKGMDNYDILNTQIATAKRQLEFARSKQIHKIILIHGNGAGVLKKELEYLLSRYSNVSYSDASYQKYGVGGATEVLFN